MVSIFPGILWVWYFYRKDRYNPEPGRIIIRDFIWGILVVIPASLVESPFGQYLTPQTPLILLFLGTIFDEPVDGIIYGVTVGLGFAAFENLFYTMLFGYRVGLFRAVLTSLAHASFTGIFGYYLSLAKQKNRRALLFYGFLLVSFLHGFYDFLVISEIMGFFYTIIAIFILQAYLVSLIRGTREKSPFK